MSSLGGLSPQAAIALGILIGLISTSIQSLGLTLQRKSHILEDEKAPDDHKRPPYRRRRWQIGMSMFIVSNIAGSSVQITTLPLPVLSTLQASGLVFNTICATLILGESFTRWSLIGTILVCAGAVLIAIFGAFGEPAHSLQQLLVLLQRRQFIIWMTATAIITLGIIFSVQLSKYLRPDKKNTPLMRLWRGMSYGAVSGILSAHSLLFAKSAVELIVRTVADGHNQFRHWQAWLIVFTLLTLALTQLYYLHRGLRLCSTSILYPFVFCIYNIVAILDGLIYFDQTNQLTLLHALLIALGTVVLLGGVFALSWRLSLENPVAQNPLTPGMCLVHDEGCESDALLPPNSPCDIETAYTAKEVGTAQQPRPKTIQIHSDTILSLPPLSANSFSPQNPAAEAKQSKHRSSLRSASNPTSKRNSRARFDLPESVEIPAPPAQRPFSPLISTGCRDQHTDESEEEPGAEHTSLLKRTNTGRTYRDSRRRRRASLPSPHSAYMRSGRVLRVDGVEQDNATTGSKVVDGDRGTWYKSVRRWIEPWRGS